MNKFEKCTVYGEWDEVDRQFYLSTALEGATAQILRDSKGNIADTAGLILLLQSRFGTEHQGERFRAELYARRRKPGETLQELYQDIDRLMSLAYPGPISEDDRMSGWVGRDVFLDALGDQSLRVRILDKDPKNMDEALRIAIRLEAYEEYRAPPSRSSAVNDPKQFRTKEHYSRVVKDDNEQHSFQGNYSDRVDTEDN